MLPYVNTILIILSGFNFVNGQVKFVHALLLLTRNNYILTQNNRLQIEAAHRCSRITSRDFAIKSDSLHTIEVPIGDNEAMSFL